MYDVRKDPDCLNNLIHSPAFTDLAGKLKQQLFGQLKQQGDPRMFGNGKVFDQYPYAGPEKDFYNRFKTGKVNANTPKWVNPTDFEKMPIK
jgi:N-sulfoglucosamine sulfohydrolase